MTIKESSDELNAPVVTSGVATAFPAGRRSLSDYLALSIATCGVGYLPLAPGTWGSIVGVGMYVLWQLLRFRFFRAFDERYGAVTLGAEALWTSFGLALVFSLTLAGTWAASRVEKLSGRKDASIVVIDEVAGQLITFLFVPVLGFDMGWPLVIVGFLLFRVFDIWKPYPIRRLEALESGLGVMADDVLAGIYAALSLSLLTAIYLLI